MELGVILIKINCNDFAIISYDVIFTVSVSINTYYRIQCRNVNLHHFDCLR